MRSFRLFAHVATLAAGISLSIGCGGNASTPTDAEHPPVAKTSEALLGALSFAFAHVHANAVDATRSFTSGGGSNGVTRTAAGSYTVSFANVGRSAGNAQVVAEGSDAKRCRLLGWYPSGADQHVDVQCNLPDGTPADSDFEAMFYVGSGTWSNSQFTDSAYAWFSPSGTMPSGVYNYNSKYGGATPNTVTSIGTGSYRVQLAGVVYQNASVLVSAYGGAGAPFCNVGGWTPSGSDTLVTVNCFDTLGAPATNVGFSLSYATSGPTLEQQGGHAWMFYGGMSPSYALAVGPSLGCSGTLTQVGANGVQVGGLSPWSGALVQTAFTSSYSMSPTYCKLTSFTPTSSSGQAIVGCYNADGSAAAAANFTVSITSNQPSGPC